MAEAARPQSATSEPLKAADYIRAASSGGGSLVFTAIEREDFGMTNFNYAAMADGTLGFDS